MSSTIERLDQLLSGLSQVIAELKKTDPDSLRKQFYSRLEDLDINIEYPNIQTIVGGALKGLGFVDSSGNPSTKCFSNDTQVELVITAILAELEIKAKVRAELQEMHG